MKRSVAITVVLIFSFISVTQAAIPTNVVIERLDNVYKFVAAKNGGLERVDVSTQVTFRARRACETAFLIEYYDDFVKVKKASGGEVSYNPIVDNDVFFTDTKRCAVAVELKKVGDKKNATINLVYTKPEFFCFEYIHRIYDIENASYTFEFPASISERYKVMTRNVPDGMLQMRTEQRSDKVVVTYTATNIPRFKHFEDAPSLRTYMPQFVITGHFADHDDIYRYLCQYLPKSDPGAQTVIDKARQVTAGIAADAERIAAITDFVHDNIRYVAVENGDLGHRPELPSEVLQKAYGDCKGSAALIKAMLCAVGIDGRLVWIGSEGVGHTFTEIPNLSAGNHMIAAAMIGDSVVYIDGTARFTPAFQTPPGIQGCQCLIENTSDRCIVATVPVSIADINAKRSSMDVRVQTGGRIGASGVMELSGTQANGFCAMAADIPPSQRDNFYCRVFEGAIRNGHAESVIAEVSEGNVMLKGTITVDGAVKQVAGETFVEVNPGASLQNYKFDLSDRQSPGDLGPITMVTDTLAFDVPDGMKLSFMPENVSVSNPWISAEVTTRISGDSRQIIRSMTFRIINRIIPFAKLKSFNSDINRLINACSTKIGLKSIE